jgi:hypothetical protein
LNLVDANLNHATCTPGFSTSSIKLGSVPGCRMACLAAMGRSASTARGASRTRR